MAAKKQILVYDTTLRDGAQSEDVNFSLEDKLRIAERLDELGVADYIQKPIEIADFSARIKKLV